MRFLSQWLYDGVLFGTSGGGVEARLGFGSGVGVYLCMYVESGGFCFGALVAVRSGGIVAIWSGDCE